MSGITSRPLRLKPGQAALSLIDGALFYRTDHSFTNVDGVARLAHDLTERLLRSHNIEPMPEARSVTLHRKERLEEASRRSGVSVEEIEARLAKGKPFIYQDTEPLVRREKGK